MRILLFSTSPRAFRAGGMETVFRTLASELRAHGHHVDEVHHEAVSYRERRDGGDVWGLPLRMIRTRWKLPTPRSAFESLRSLVWVMRCVRRARPDVVNVHFVNAYALYFALLRPLFGYRLVLTSHGSDLMCPSKLDRALLPYILRRADAVTTVSAALYQQVVSLDPALATKATVIANGVDFEYWSQPGHQPTAVASSSDPTLVSVGRMERVKGHDVLLRAFAAVLDDVPDARLLLVGDGTQRGALEALAAELGIESHVKFLGSLESEDIRAVFRQADIFVLPSRSEGMGLAMLEAMAAGVPVIASAVGGVPSVLRGDVGLLVPSEDPYALAASIVGMLSSNERRAYLSVQSRRRAATYGWGPSIVRYERVYRGGYVSLPACLRISSGASVHGGGDTTYDFKQRDLIVSELRALPKGHSDSSEHVNGAVVGSNHA